MSQLDRDWPGIVQEAHAAKTEADRLGPLAFGDLVTLIAESCPLRDEGIPKPLVAPGTIVRDLGGNIVNTEPPPFRRFTADRCPFYHEERTFGLLEGASHFWCCSCQQAGGAVEWIMVMDDVSGVEAVRRLRARLWLQ